MSDFFYYLSNGWNLDKQTTHHLLYYFSNKKIDDILFISSTKKKKRKKKEFKGVGLTLQALEDLVFFFVEPCMRALYIWLRCFTFFCGFFFFNILMVFRYFIGFCWNLDNLFFNYYVSNM